MLTRRDSTGFLGASYSSGFERSGCSGAGSARRSIFPLGVKGIASRDTKADGNMKSGSLRFRKLRSSEDVGIGFAGTKYATKRLSPGMSSLAKATNFNLMIEPP